ncbi:Hemin transport system permease protein HmuU [Brevibacterium ravenspurgense]|uniref:Hemin transport system permease protein HmuU n=1 Tax=Brevibacterium ravenspurgense TaxID=479117 RepID=A0A150HAY2_9MICO|nr:Hemin transport system permease protein HmuU [Brevibacterium ravenspurgense]
MSTTHSRSAERFDAPAPFAGSPLDEQRTRRRSRSASSAPAARVPGEGRGEKTSGRVSAARVTTVFTTLVVLLLGGTLLSAMLGQLYIAPKEVVGSVLQSVGINWLPGPSHEFGAEALWEVRFPRIVLTVFVGAALAIAGAVMQGIFGNPLAEPGTIGVSSGAAVGASFAFLHGLSFLGGFTVPFLAFVCGLVTTIVVYVLARSNGRTEVVTLILTGVAVNAISGALISFIVFKAPTQAREQIVFWQMGSFNGSRWEQVAIVVPLVVVGIGLTMFLARGLDLVSLGEKAARHLGVDVERLRLYAMVLSALLVSAAVAFVGIIAFVGLVVPHLMRMLLGPGHRLLLPASVLGGAVLLTFADLAARTLIEFADLPIGMLTALIGGPYFFYLLRRSRREAGGWA